uniref:Uncharacterized protein n=1 Tax=Trichobilharzia regenti TaxID=157069 RepID=A0AA85J7Y7_TRIRE|nr:unnamed protein product [Trichobilharzia regenti]
MRFGISLLGYFIIFLTILLNNVNGQDADQVIFNLKKFILDIWLALCTRLGETWGCLLDALSVQLGGKGRTCISLSP